MRKSISLLLILAMVFTMVIGGTTSVFAAESTAATTMKIAGADGTVTVTNEKGKEIAAKVDTKLLNGYTIKTAAASYCFISLDDSKAIKLGQNTKVKVEKSGKKIELNVKSGEIYFDVDKKLSGNESMNIKTGNMTTGIRGTSGVARILEQIAKLQLFSGSTQSKAVGLAGTSTTLNIAAGQELNASFTDLNAGANPTQPTQPGQQVQTETAADGVSISTNPIAMDNFAVRSIIETSAIKSGVSATQALAAKAEEIIEKAADLLQKLDITQEAKNQIEKVTAEPEKLDTAKANAETQAAIEQTLNEQTIETAQQEAAQAPGTTSDTTESKVLENVEVKNEAGANASALSLSEDGTSTTATDTPAEQPKSSGSHSGSASSALALTGYTGVYDANRHPITKLTEEQKNNYHFWFFTDIEVQASFLEAWAGREVGENLATDIRSFASSYDGYYDVDSDNMRTACNVFDSKQYYYVAIPISGSEPVKGELNVNITQAELFIKWYTDGGKEVTTGVQYPLENFSSDSIPSSSKITPKFYMLENGAYVQVNTDQIWASTNTPVMASIQPTLEQTTDNRGVCNLTVTGISYVDSTNNNQQITAAQETVDFRLSSSNRTFSYSYVLDRSVSSDFFSGDSWKNKSNYDIAFVKQDGDTTGTYDKYLGETSQGTATIDEILAILGDPNSEYSSVYLDTKDNGQFFTSSMLSSDISIVSGAYRRAVYIRGAGFFGPEGQGGVSFRSEGLGKLMVQLGGDQGDVDVFMEFPEISVGADVTINCGEAHLDTNNLRILGIVNCYGNSIVELKPTATGSICVGGGNGYMIPQLNMFGRSQIIDNRVYSFTSDGTSSLNNIEPLFVLSSRGRVQFGINAQTSISHAVSWGEYSPAQPADFVDSEEAFAVLQNMMNAMFGRGSIAIGEKDSSNNITQSVCRVITYTNEGESTPTTGYGIHCSYGAGSINEKIIAAYSGNGGTLEDFGMFWITTENCEYSTDSGFIKLKFPANISSYE